MTIITDAITSHEIRIRIKTIENNALLSSMFCVATLQGKNSTQIYVSNHRYELFFDERVLLIM